MSINVGDQAPDFTLKDQDSVETSLSEYRGKQTVVLYFYPKDETPVCTKEACGFRDNYEAFVDAGAAVIGVSSDSVESHRSFATTRALPFRLLADTQGEVRKLFGVPKALGLMPGRVTYIIDKEGVVRESFNSMLFADKHINGALATVRELAGSK
jgi:peroxiredoxin Q/BCP